MTKIDHITGTLPEIARTHGLAVLLGADDAKAGRPRRTSRELAEHFCSRFTAAQQEFFKATYEVGYHQVLWAPPPDPTTIKAPPTTTEARDPMPSLEDLERELEA